MDFEDLLKSKFEDSDVEVKKGEVTSEEVVQNDSENRENLALQPVSSTPKAITDINLSDVKVKIDTTKSAGEQTKEVIDFAATVSAAQDQDTLKKISDAKKAEIVREAEVKAKEASVKSTHADTEVQKAKREKFEILFETFGVTKHIPDWLLKVLMCIFAPFYILFVIIIGIPTGFIRFLIDCTDGILIRYDNTEEKRRPKIKVTVWVILSLIVVAAICLTTLACMHII